MAKNRKLTKLDHKIVDYLRRECARLHTAYHAIKKQKPGSAEEIYRQGVQLIEVVAQAHNLSTVADVVHEMFLTEGK